MPVPARVPGHDGRYRFREYEPRDRKVLGVLRAVAHDEPPSEAWGKPPADEVVHRTVVLCDEQERGRVVGAARGMAQDLSWELAAERYEQKLIEAKYSW